MEKRAFLVVAIGLFVLPFNFALADDFYEGKTIRFIVGYAAGGGYDTYTRAVARHMGKHIPGNPSVVVENTDGAGSLLAANHLIANSLLAATIFRLGSSLTALAPENALAQSQQHPIAYCRHQDDGERR